MLNKILNLLTWFNGKKRRFSILCLAIAPQLSHKYGSWFYLAGIIFGGADAAKLANEKRKSRKKF